MVADILEEMLGEGLVCAVQTPSGVVYSMTEIGEAVREQEVMLADGGMIS